MLDNMNINADIPTKEIYEDLVQPFAHDSGKILGLIPRTVYAFLSPLRRWINDTEMDNLIITAKLISEKLSGITIENIVAPEPYVAIPALQAICYTMNSDELRNMYASLLAKAMQSDTKNEVHPAFVEIIKQLSPYDVMLLKSLKQRNLTLPIINYFATVSYPEQRTYLAISNAFDYFVGTRKLTQASLDNLIRLGLIKIDFSSQIKNLQIYEDLEQKYIPILEKIKTQAIGVEIITPQPHVHFIDKITPQFGLLLASEFGVNFCSICL